MYENLDDISENYFLIRFGKKEHLERILQGYLRFTKLTKYQNFENCNIGDDNEGLKSIIHQDGSVKIEFKHPKLDHGKYIDISGGIESIRVFPNTNKYIACFSYFTDKEMANGRIVSSEIIMENEWGYALVFFDSVAFINSVFQVLNEYQVLFSKVRYVDYNNTQNNLTEFIKSDKYKYQKEMRFSIDFYNKETPFIRIIDSDVIEVDLKKTFQGAILPTQDLNKIIF